MNIDGEIFARSKFFEQKELWRKYLAEEINRDLENFLSTLTSEQEKQIVRVAMGIVKGPRVE